MLSLSKVLLALPTERAGYALIELTAGAKACFAPSRRICMHYILQGSITLESGAVTRPLATGDFVCLPRGNEHNLRTANPIVTRHTRLLGALELADQPRRVRFGAAHAPVQARVLSASYYLRGTGGVPPGSLMADVAVLPVGEAALSSMPPPVMTLDACSGAGACAFTAGLMRLLFIQALRLDVTRRLDDEHLDYSSGPSNKVGRAQALIERHLSEQWSVAKLAKTVGMARSTFAQRFAASIGESPIATLSAFRLAEARRLLEGHAEITEIAHAVGYSSLTAFSRAFRKHHGETPTAFRKRRQREKSLAS